MALSKKLKAILNRKNERIEGVPDGFDTKVGKSQNEILAELLASLQSLDTQGGSLIPSEENLIKVEAIIAQLKGFVSTSEYIEAVREFANEFDLQKGVNDEFFDDAFDDFSTTKQADDLVLSSKRNTVRKLITDSLDAPFYNPIRDTLIDSVSSGTSLRDTIKALQIDVIGGESKGNVVLGKLQRYSKQIATDAFAEADRAYSVQVGEDLNAQFYLYSGGLISDSRVFCVNRNGKFWHRNEITDWGEGINIDSGRAKGKERAGVNWQGKRENTNATTIFRFLGGFNCLHSVMPTSTFAVPKNVLLENIANGNWIPTNLERQQLL